MKLSGSFISGFVGLFVFSSLASADSAMQGFQKLSLAEQKVVQDGGQVVQFGEQKPWPSVTIYERINATPEESVAVFFDYANQLNYIPNLTRAIPASVSKTVFNVDYQVKLPFIPAWLGGTEDYLVRDELLTSDSGHAYEIQWTLIKGQTITTSNGYAKFENLGTGTLLAYNSFIVPTRTGSDWGFVIDGAKDSVKKAVTSIVKQVEKEKSDNSVLFQTQLEKLKAALSN